MFYKSKSPVIVILIKELPSLMYKVCYIEIRFSWSIATECEHTGGLMTRIWIFLDTFLKIIFDCITRIYT